MPNLEVNFVPLLQLFMVMPLMGPTELLLAGRVLGGQRERIMEGMDERDLWNISVLIEATKEQADAALEAIARALCPDEHHAGPCPVPWTTIRCQFSELEDHEKAGWREELQQDGDRDA